MDDKINKMRSIKTDNLSSKVSFSDWLEKNIPFFENNKPTNEEMKIILKYIKKQVFENRLTNKKEYLKNIKSILNRIENEEERA